MLRVFRSGARGAEVVARCVERDAELVGVAADLGEEKSALNTGHGGGGEHAGISIFAQPATASHTGETVAQAPFPALEAGGDRRPGLWVALRELAGERAERAAAACLLVGLMLDECVEPAVDTGPGVQVVEEFALRVEDGVDGDIDDGVDEVISVFEVVVELTAAGAGSCPDVVKAHAGGALLGDELSGSLQDSLARRTSLRRCGCGRIRHDNTVADLDLTVQL